MFQKLKVFYLHGGANPSYCEQSIQAKIFEMVTLVLTSTDIKK